MPDSSPITPATLPESAAAHLRAKYRRLALPMLIAGLIAIAFEWWEITQSHSYHLIAVVAAFLGVLVGLPGTIEPRLMWGVSRDARTAPLAFRIAGNVLLLLAVALGLGACALLSGWI